MAELDKPFSDWDSTEVSQWLTENGLPLSVCETFEDEMIDGAALGELTEGDVKSLVKPLGQVKRIVRAINSLKATSKEKNTSTEIPFSVASLCSLPGSTSSRTATPLSMRGDTSGTTTPLSGQSETSRPSTPTVTLPQRVRPSSTPSRRTSSDFEIPTRWKPSIMAAITEKRLNPEVRNSISRDLMTHVYSYVGKPSSEFVEDLAKKLVQNYPFMADSGDCPHGSWTQKLTERVYNIEKEERKRKATGNCDLPRKRGRPKKSSSVVSSRYPPLVVNISDVEEDQKALDLELQKEKPRKEIVLELMKATYYSRRRFLLHDTAPVSAKVTKYPSFKMPSVIEQEMDLVMVKQGVYRIFAEDFTRKWVPAIIAYSKGSKRKDVKALFAKEDDEEKVALSCLFYLLCIQPKKKDESRDFNHLLKEYEMTDDPEVVAAISAENVKSPRIGRFTPEDGNEEYFIFVEDLVLCKVNTFVKALFLWFSLFYIFHLSYPSNLVEVCLFFQEFVFGIPDTGMSKSLTYKSVTTDIQSITFH